MNRFGVKAFAPHRTSAVVPSMIRTITRQGIYHEPTKQCSQLFTASVSKAAFSSLSSSMISPLSQFQTTVHTKIHRQSSRLFSTTIDKPSPQTEGSIFAPDSLTFESLGIQSPILLQRLKALGFDRPTKVQAESFAKLQQQQQQQHTHSSQEKQQQQQNTFIIGSETGSGKTLAYLLPLLDDILMEKATASSTNATSKSLSYDYARAIILVPNKELVQQVLRMALPLCSETGGTEAIVFGGGFSAGLDHMSRHSVSASSSKSSVNNDPSTIVRLAVLPGGLNEPMDFKPFRDTLALGGNNAPVDIVLATPASLGPWGLKPKNLPMFADIATLIIDEADMLLDGGYMKQLENVLLGFRRADRVDPTLVFSTNQQQQQQQQPQNHYDNRDESDASTTSTTTSAVPSQQQQQQQLSKTQIVFCAATLPDMGLKSVDAYLQRKFPRAERICMAGMHNARHYGLKQPTQWIGPMDSRKERMDYLVNLFQLDPIIDMDKTSSSADDDESNSLGGLKDEKVMIFLNTVEDVEGAQAALEMAGLKSVPYHAKIRLEERSQNLDRFRRYAYNPNASSDDNTDADDTVPILVCTDLASRGLDVPGVNAVVQLQFSGNVVSHLHRMGRCGRAGQRTGRGIVFYSAAEANLVDVVQEAERQQERMVLQGDVADDSDSDSPQPERNGNVKDAFSRKRGFARKRKKLQREAQ